MGKNWDPDTVIHDLHEEFISGGLSAIKHTYVDEKLCNAARRKFGKYGAAVDRMFKEHGIDHTFEDVKKAPTKGSQRYDEKAFKWLYDRWKSGKYLDISELYRAEGTPIHTLIHETRYRSMENIIDELKRRYPDVDITYEQIKERSKQRKYDEQRTWSLQKIKERILAHHERGVELGDPHYLSYTNMVDIDSDLVSVASSSYLKGWEKSVMATSDEFGLGLDYTEIRKDKDWDKEKIDARIKEIGNQDPMLLLEPAIMDIDKRVFEAALRPSNYGAWIKAVETNGFDYKKLQRRHKKERHEKRKEELGERIFEHFKDGRRLDRKLILGIDKQLVHGAEYRPYFQGSWYEAVGYAIRHNLNFAIITRKHEEAAAELMRVYNIRNDPEFRRFSLLASYRGDNDIEARNRFIKENMGLLWDFAQKEYEARKSRSQPTLSVEALVNEGMFGMIRGMDKFDFARDVKISTYIGEWIRSLMQRANINLSREIRIPVNVVMNRKRIYGLIEKRKEDGIFLTEEEIAEELGMNIDRVKRALLKQPISMHDYVGDGDTEFEHFIEDTKTPLPDDVAIYSGTREKVTSAMDKLEPRERYILEQRFYKERTLEDVGNDFNITRERVRQIQDEALEKLGSGKTRQELMELYADS